MTRSATIVLALMTSTAIASSAGAQAFDGDYTATIRCTAFPGTDIGAFSQQMKFKVAGTTITGERNVGTPTQVGALGTVEKWTGTLGPDGAIAVTSNSASSRAPIQGSFGGTATRAGFDLKGRQTYTTSRTGGSSTRDCSVTAKR